MTSEKLGCVFPGQGSQCVGMGQDLSENFVEARQTFEEVDDALGYKLSTLMFDGPEDTLRQTKHAQPALMAVSMAVMRILEAHKRPFSSFSMAAGHSLGEFSALCAAGVLTLAETAKLLDIRGRAMEKAVPEGGAMAAVINLAEEKINEIPISDQRPVCVIANDNCVGQIVLSGHKEGVDKAGNWIKEQGARFIPLNVSGPFHSPLMKLAAEQLSDALEEITFKKPRVAILTNVSATPQTDPAVLKEHIKAQVTGRVRWRETMDRMVKNDVQKVLELGSGRVLCGLFKRQHPSLETLALGDQTALKSFLGY